MNRLALAIAIYFALTITCIADIPTTDSLTDQRAFLEQISLNETPTKGEGDLSDLSEPKGEKYESA